MVKLQEQGKTRTGCGRLLVCTLMERNNVGAPCLSVFSRCQILRSGPLMPSSSCKHNVNITQRKRRKTGS